MKITMQCQEKEGPVRRTVSEMPKSLEVWLETVEKLRLVPNFLHKSDFENTKEFLKDENKFFLVDDVGAAAVLPDEKGSAHVHITFWDGRLRGREALMRELAIQVKDQMKLDTLYTAIPVDSHSVIAFAIRVGFVRGAMTAQSILMTF